NLLQLDGPPSWSQGVANLRWRVHVVDVRGKVADFRSGRSNSCSFWQQAVGSWQTQRLQPGIMDVELGIERGTAMHVRLGPPRARAGASGTSREIRSVVLADNVCFCLEHRRPEVGLHCFCPEALADANGGGPPASEVTSWESTADYVAGWRAAVELEAAASAAGEGDSRLLYNVEVAWGQNGRGSFDIPSALASAHRMKLRGLLASEDGPAEWASAWLCMRRPSIDSAKGAGWSGHAGVIGAALVGEDQSEQPLASNVGEEEEWLLRMQRGESGPSASTLRVTFQLNPEASDSAPNPAKLGGRPQTGYLIEFIWKSLPYSCMAVALSELSTASPLLKETILNAREPPPATSAAPRPNGSDDTWHSQLQADDKRGRSIDLSSWSLNPPQEAAVRATLDQQLTLIHGPPGTGKTTTAAALCVLFALSNLDAGVVAAVLYCTPSNDAADVACLRVAQTSGLHFQAVAKRFHRVCLEKAMAAGNRGCPLCRRPLRQPEGGLSALRVYSAEMERSDFPVPKRVDHPSAKPRKSRGVPESMRPYALHWRCHGRSSSTEPTQEAVLTGRAYERMMIAGASSPSFDELRLEYFLLLAEARAAELRRADCIFATCVSARRGGLAAALAAEGAPELRQVVVDESGQAPEPEALCPLTLARAAQKIVLVGDPKQLRPIINSPAALRLGLGVSLLERLSNAPGARPRLLSLQYRMHVDLNAFPSAYFYGGAVRTDPAVLQRQPGLLAHPSRPKKSAALLFWTSVGGPAEQISQVRTSESSAKSRSNQAEAARAAELALRLAGIVGGEGKVAVLSWYNAQVFLLKDLLQGSGVYVGGVVSAQGNEWDYVILSTVRSAPGGLGALGDEHLLDVALTRARHGMCVPWFCLR
ncbi:unnamed protein product, partial [Polarella glacialis]